MAPVLGSTLQFSELVDDVILLVLVHCDISSVLAVGQTSKQLHRLASEKYLWLSLVTDLARRGFIDRPPDDDLRDLSKDQLVGLVKKIVVGPRPLRHKNKVLESRRITLPQGHTTDPNAFGRTLRLLPGGKYVLLFRRRISLECWSIADQKMIWTHVCSVKGVVVEDFAVQLTDERHFVIMTSHYHSSAQRNFAEFTAVDLASGRSRFIRASYPEHYGYPLVSIMHLAICGDIAAIYCADEHFMLLLINWRTGSYAMVQLSVDDDVYFFTNVMCVALVPHYAILVLPSKNGDYAFSVVPLLAFPWSTDTVDLQNAGSGLAPSSGVVQVSDLPAICTQPIPFLFSASTYLGIAALESPLHRGRFRVWICCHSQTCCHEFTVSPTAVSCRHARTESLELGFSKLLFSGQAVHWYWNRRDDVLDLTPYSWTLAVSDNSSEPPNEFLSVVYYK